MNHLTIDEIIEFVSSCNADTETLQLISKVNQHIRSCSQCFQLVQSFQMVYDEFTASDEETTFERYLYQRKIFNRNGCFADPKENVVEDEGNM